MPVWFIKKLAVKAAEKATKIDATNVWDQMNVDDILTILKGLL
jgi:hypothetical protein